MSEGTEEKWLLVDIEGEIAHFGITDATNAKNIRNSRSYKTADFPTATDCFMAYSKEIGLPLKGLKCGVSVTGAVGADSVRLQRCRWVFSISGLSYLLGSRPLVINDSQIKSWTNLTLDSKINLKFGGQGEANFSNPGKWITINYGNGLGASMLCRESQERVYAIDSECGHIGFAPQDELQERLLHFLSKTRSRVTYEHMLFLDRSDALLMKSGITMTQDELDKMRAAILGAFVGDIVLSFVGWSGVFVHSISKQFLQGPEMVGIFNEKFEDKGNFKSNMRAVPRYLVSNLQNNLPGVAQMMAMQNFAN